MGPVATDANRKSERTEALYREHRAAVAALCRSLLRDGGEAEDATQQVFLSAHRALLNGAEPREPLAWLLAVARNECYARYRRRSTTPIPSGDSERENTTAVDVSVHVLYAEEVAGVWDEVRQMPPAQRDAFLLREIRGLSYQQLAEELSLSPPSVRSLLLRARTRLRHRLGDVAAAGGGVPWVQTLLRVVLGGDGASPLRAATKAAAVGLGALALTTGGDLPRATHRPSTTSPRSATTHRAMAQRPRFPESPATRAVVERETRSGTDNSLDGATGRDDSHGGSNTSTSDGSGSRRDSSDGGDNALTTGSVAQLTASGDGRDGGSSSSSGPGPGTLTTTTSSGSGSSASDSSNSGSGTSGSGGSDGSGISGGSGSDGGGLDG